MISIFKSVYSARLKNGAHFSYNESVYKYLSEDETYKAAHQDLLTAYKAAIDTEDKMLMQVSSVQQTEQVEAAYNNMRSSYSGLVHLLKGYEKSADSAKAQAAKDVRIRVGNYSINSATQRQNVSGLVENLVGDLLEMYDSQLTSLNLMEQVTELKTLNEAYTSAAENRREYTKEYVTAGTISARKATDTAYGKVMKALESEITLGKETVYKSLEQSLNAIIKEYRDLNGISSSSTQSSTDNSSSGTSTTEGDGSSQQTTTKYTLTLAASPTAGGTVTGAGQYESGTSATITATAASGYTFTQWSDGNTSASRTVTVSADTTLTATFTADVSDPDDSEGFHT